MTKHPDQVANKPCFEVELELSGQKRGAMVNRSVSAMGHWPHVVVYLRRG